MANMGISSSREPNPASPDEFVGSVGQYYGSGNSATSIGASGNGLSGSGRAAMGETQAEALVGGVHWESLRTAQMLCPDVLVQLDEIDTA
jgi:hypothetical protein